MSIISLLWIIAGLWLIRGTRLGVWFGGRGRWFGHDGTLAPRLSLRSQAVPLIEGDSAARSARRRSSGPYCGLKPEQNLDKRHYSWIIAPTLYHHTEYGPLVLGLLVR